MLKHTIFAVAPVMGHVHLNCRELVIHPFVLALESSAEHTHLDYREQVVGIFTLTVVSWWLGISALTVELGWGTFVCSSCEYAIWVLRRGIRDRTG